ncbi:MAG: dTMP kinase [Candidatus Omnitrophica bacterium]|nr:dTMP kinase [Candidatus Omnitrophota bacterium]
MKKKKGIFITFEGIEGSGKSSHCKLAAQHLKRKGYDVLTVREPGGTKIGEKIRQILLDKKNSHMTVECELLLYNAARVQIVREVIMPALQKGTIVLCDRFIDSTIAYQCYGGGLDRTIATKINNFATGTVMPMVTFLLDSDVGRGLKRAGRGDRMELKSFAFHKRVRKGFLTIAKQYPRRFCVIKECTIDEGRKIITRKLNVLFP